MMVSRATTIREAWDAYSLSVLREEAGADQHLVARHTAFLAGARAVMVLLEQFDTAPDAMDSNLELMWDLRRELKLDSEEASP